ncbi:hypothetical protein Dsin_029225 [Dipteronia sinensis]|uniref:Uncharacterized protein n=1 Tax=Dipteronia sinensis TaxID=43782 RepID=A0AAD9ZSF1_9ROSI|nr:hypothetical protein Dsin_029225 [Dipteronia sinensis]
MTITYNRPDDGFSELSVSPTLRRSSASDRRRSSGRPFRLSHPRILSPPTITPEALESVKAALASSEIEHKAETKKKAFPWKAAGQAWEDPTLADWPESKYIGNRPIKLRKSKWKERTDVDALVRQKGFLETAAIGESKRLASNLISLYLNRFSHRSVRGRSFRLLGPLSELIT